ncbi:MAG: hypothetical protein FWD22_06385 [Treponema sp.]|nr:hypothetical protein [Treponema sp.]
MAATGSIMGGAVENYGTFTMNGGVITANTCDSDTGTPRGGGVYNTGTFIMNDGEISGNHAFNTSGNAYGAGVYNSSGTFIMNDGKISNNLVFSRWGNNNSLGGGVYIDSGTFIMNGGEISGNSADRFGGGVYVTGSGNFRITNGIIYGIDEADTTIRNRTDSTTGAVLYKAGTSNAVQYGTFSGETWNGTDIPLTVSGSNAFTNNTIKVVNGELQ